MAIIKPDMKRVWAEGAPDANVVDPDTTTPGKFDQGWVAEVPPFEHFNFIQNKMTESLAYLNEQGTPEWDADTVYPVGSIVKASDGTLYGATVEQSDNDPVLDDNTNWRSGASLVLMDAGESVEESLIARSRTNLLINGAFDIWQRADSQTSNGYGSDDRWRNLNIGSTKTHSRQNFNIGQTEVSGQPVHFSRTVVSSITGSSNNVLKQQRLDGVTGTGGQTVTLQFYAKADAPKNIAVELEQVFGTGGSPSSTISGIGAELIPLTTEWQKFEMSIEIPSISGKTLGTDNNSLISINFWMDAGNNFAAQTLNLGHQSGTFDLAQIQLELGNAATKFENRVYAEELFLCNRYYEKGTYGGSVVWDFPVRGWNPYVNFVSSKREVPTLSITHVEMRRTNNIVSNPTPSIYLSDTKGFGLFWNTTTGNSNTVGYNRFNWTADAEI